MIKLSTSKIKCYKACRRLYYFKYVEGLESVKPIEALEDGKSYHSKIEHLYKDGSIEIDYENPKITAMALAYQKYIYPHFVCKRVEEWFEHKITPSLILIGRFDGIAEDGCIVEHKTTSSDVDEEYIYNLRLDEQILNYMVASKKNKIYYTVCKKPTIRQKQNETDEEFLQRCVEWYDTDTDLKIRVIKVTRNQKEIDEQRKALAYIGKEIKRIENQKEAKELSFYRNPNYCQQYGRTCEFASICLNYDPKLEYIEFKKKEKENGV